MTPEAWDALDPTVALGVAVCVAAGGLVVAIVAGVLAVAVWRRLRTRDDPRAEVLRGLGYEATGDGRWLRAVPGMPLTYRDAAEGGRWTARLPRYSALSIRIEERHGGGPVDPAAFRTGDVELDDRFVVHSNLPSQALELLADQEVGDALLDIPVVGLALEADELVITDPSGEALRRISGDAPPDTRRGLKAEAHLHERALRLARAVVAALPR